MSQSLISISWTPSHQTKLLYSAPAKYTEPYFFLSWTVIFCIFKKAFNWSQRKTGNAGELPLFIF